MSAVLLNDSVIEKLFALAVKADVALTSRAGYKTNNIKTYLELIINHGRVEVGYRSSCGKTDFTQYVYREWCKLLKAAEKIGINISVEPIKHGNSWATKKGGFWSSAIYVLEVSE